MKQFKNVTLAVLSGLLILSVATVSCKKKSSSPSTPTPTVTGFTPATVAKGASLTISGTNLTSPATVSINGGTAITATVSSDGTTITVTVPSTATSGTVVVTINGTNYTVPGGSVNVTAALTPVDGLTSSNQVAPTALIAYFPFDGNSTESVSGNSDSIHVQAAYSAGVIGQALNLGTGSGATATPGYLVFPAIPAINVNNGAMDQYTISMWVKIAASNATEYTATGGRYSSLFQITSRQVGDIYGPTSLTLHTNEAHATDSFYWGAVLRQIDGRNITYNGQTGTDHEDDSTHAGSYAAGAGDGSKWIFVAQSFYGYDNNPRPLVTYVNGDSVDTHLFYNLIGPGENLNLRPGGGNNNVSFGTFAFSDDFGADTPWGGPGSRAAASTKIYWGHGIVGSIDDVRIFNTPLTDQNISDLYQLGLQGR